MLKKIDYMAVLNRIICTIFAVMIVIMIVVLIIGVVDLFIDIGDLAVKHQLRSGYLEIIYDVLTLFIVIELMRSVTEYFTAKRIRMTFIADAGIVFVVREIMIKLFEGHVEAGELYGLSALIVALTILRVGSVLLHQRDIRLTQENGK